MKTLKNLSVGEKATVVKVSGSGAIRRRLMDMGVIKGTEIQLLNVAPLGDPLKIKVRGYQLSLRKSEAKEIQVS